MSEDYGAIQSCPQCTGALYAAEQRMRKAQVQAKAAYDEARDLKSLAATEDLRGRNADSTHFHVPGPGRRAEGQCTLVGHRAAAVRLLRERVAVIRFGRKCEREALREARSIAAAGRRLLEGCTLCGRAPLPANGRVAA